MNAKKIEGIHHQNRREVVPRDARHPSIDNRRNQRQIMRDCPTPREDPHVSISTILANPTASSPSGRPTHSCTSEDIPDGLEECKGHDDLDILY